MLRSCRAMFATRRGHWPESMLDEERNILVIMQFISSSASSSVTFGIGSDGVVRLSTSPVLQA